MIVNIRSMKETDLDDVYTIETEVHISPWSKEIIRDCFLVGYDCKVLELKLNDAPVLAGYIISRLSQDQYHILNFCIAKSFQFKGLGRKFLQAVLDSLSNQGQVKSVLLEVRPSNSVAIHLYTSLDFETVAVKKDYYKDKSGMEDAIVLKKNV